MPQVLPIATSLSGPAFLGDTSNIPSVDMTSTHRLINFVVDKIVFGKDKVANVANLATTIMQKSNDFIALLSEWRRVSKAYLKPLLGFYTWPAPQKVAASRESKSRSVNKASIFFHPFYRLVYAAFDAPATNKGGKSTHSCVKLD